MEITVYLAENDRFVLTPACFLPSNACEHDHGPLQRCGQINVTDARDQVAWQCILDDIDDHAYAALSRVEATCLLGLGHACFAVRTPRPQEEPRFLQPRLSGRADRQQAPSPRSTTPADEQRASQRA